MGIFLRQVFPSKTIYVVCQPEGFRQHGENNQQSVTETAGTASNQEVHTPHIYAFLFYLVLQCLGSEAPIF